MNQKESKCLVLESNIGYRCGCYGDRNGCKIKYVKFKVDGMIVKREGIVWKRDPGSVHDWDEDFKKNPWDCDCCGVKYGKIHHTANIHGVYCPNEKCPSCGGQLFSCDCNGTEEDLKSGRWGHIFLEEDKSGESA